MLAIPKLGCQHLTALLIANNPELPNIRFLKAEGGSFLHTAILAQHYDLARSLFRDENINLNNCRSAMLGFSQLHQINILTPLHLAFDNLSTTFISAPNSSPTNFHAAKKFIIDLLEAGANPNISYDNFMQEKMTLIELCEMIKKDPQKFNHQRKIIYHPTYDELKDTIELILKYKLKKSISFWMKQTKPQVSPTKPHKLRCNLI